MEPSGWTWKWRIIPDSKTGLHQDKQWNYPFKNLSQVKGQWNGQFKERWGWLAPDVVGVFKQVTIVLLMTHHAAQCGGGNSRWLLPWLYVVVRNIDQWFSVVSDFLPGGIWGFSLIVMTEFGPCHLDSWHQGFCDTLAPLGQSGPPSLKIYLKESTNSSE